jgi:hypothetical protein
MDRLCRVTVGPLGDSGPAAGFEAVTLENGLARVTVLPGKGADIYALTYKPGGVDVLWKSPWGLRPPGQTIATASNSLVAWMDHYEGGWQEIFPSGGGPAVLDGIEHSFHGESTAVPWHYRVVEPAGEQCVVHFWVRLARSPLFLERTMSLVADSPVLTMRERLVNEGPAAFDLMWGHHPAYGAPFIAEGCIVDAPADTFVAFDPQASSDSLLPDGGRFSWPLAAGRAGGQVDLSRVVGPERRVTNLGYLDDLREGWYAITNPHLGFGVGMTFPRDIFRHLWFWQEFGGSSGTPWFRRCYVMALEPFTSFPCAGLAAARELGTARVLEAGQALDAIVRFVFFDSITGVNRIDPDGMVHVRANATK